MSDWATGAFLAACMLLAWSGCTKLRRPDATQHAAHALGMPSTRTTVRALGSIELGVAVAGVLVGGIAALAVAAVFTGLAIVSHRLLRRAPSTPCGCLGSPEAPVSRAHVAINVGAVVVAIVAAPGVSPLAALSTQPLAGVPFVVLAACTARLAALTMDQLPALAREAARGARG
jgi:hypothetical protein